MHTDAPPPALAFRPSVAHSPRPFLWLGSRTVKDWAVKHYAITASGAAPARDLVEASLRLASMALPSADDVANGHGVAIVIAHEGRDGNYVLVDWWVGENMLAQQLFIAPVGRVEHFEPFDDRRIIACVWELQILAFEGRAWVEKVLSQPARPDIAGYLDTFLQARL